MNASSGIPSRPPAHAFRTKARTATAPVFAATDALISNDDSHVYAVTDYYDSVVVFKRDSDNGELSKTDSEPPPGNFPDATHRGLTISPDGAYLFVVKDSAFGNEVVVFGIGEDPAKPERLHALPLDTHLGLRSESGCRFGAPWRQAAGLSVFCDGQIFGLQWNAGSRRLAVADVVEGVDRFDNVLPHFEIPRSLALSPDARVWCYSPLIRYRNRYRKGFYGSPQRFH